MSQCLFEKLHVESAKQNNDLNTCFESFFSLVNKIQKALSKFLKQHVILFVIGFKTYSKFAA